MSRLKPRDVVTRSTASATDWLHVLDNGGGMKMALSALLTYIQANITEGTYFGDIGARVYNNANQTNISTATALSFNSEDYDTDGMHDNSTNNSRITINTAGKYMFVFYGSFLSSEDASFYFKKSGTTNFGYSRSGTLLASTITAIIDCSVADYVEVFVEVALGTGDIRYLDERSPYFMAQRIG